MANDFSPNQQVAPAQHTHYTALSDGSVYLAFTNDPSFQDSNPEKWRPANAEEIEAFNLRVSQVAAGMRFNADGSTKTTGTGATGATGGVIRLAEDDPVVAPAEEVIPAAIVIPPAE